MAIVRAVLCTDALAPAAYYIAMHLRLFHVDAFADKIFEGNPAAVCPLAKWLDDDFLRAVAAENNLSETAFLVPGDNRYELRWFTPRCEVRLCGHATLASAFVVLNILDPSVKSVRFETRHSGTLTVTQDGDFLSMDFPAFQPQPCPTPPAGLLQAFGALPVKVLEANETYVAVYPSEDLVRSLLPDFRLLEQLHPFAVAVTAPGKDVDFVSRYFAPSYGIPEDPVTGSAHCILTPYWSQQLGKANLHARQLSARGGDLRCEFASDRVIIRGKAILTLSGALSI
jgi:PhzF family phenazine biosynthesis protein